MRASLITGAKVASAIRADVARDVRLFNKRFGVEPRLGIILVGEKNETSSFVRKKLLAATDVGISSERLVLPDCATHDDVCGVVTSLNQCRDVHGVLVQLPLPPSLSLPQIAPLISPLKDVDCFHPINFGRLWFSSSPNSVTCPPCTSTAVIELLDAHGIDVAGKTAVVLGRSALVGKPMCAALIHRNAAVTVCHSQTPISTLQHLVSHADIVVSAIGVPKFVRGEWIKPGAVVVDIGISYGPDGSVSGDVDFDSASTVASAITPVPGGVGPVTVAVVLRNTIRAAEAIERALSDR